MSLRDFQAAEKEFEGKKKATAEKLIAMIDKRLAAIRKLEPGAKFSDAMGATFFYTEGLRNNSQDPMYIAGEYVLGHRNIETADGWGGEFPPYFEMANRIYEKYGDELKEIVRIAEFLYDEVGYSYG